MLTVMNKATNERFSANKLVKAAKKRDFNSFTKIESPFYNKDTTD